MAGEDQIHTICFNNTLYILIVEEK